MVIDASALLACLLDEPERTHFVDAVDGDPVKLVSVVGYVETSFVVLGRKGETGLSDLERFIGRASIIRVAVDTDQAELAVEAFRRFGKGRHPARLNIADCFAYALAKATGESLLFKGGDFALTDLMTAVRRT